MNEKSSETIILRFIVVVLAILSGAMAWYIIRGGAAALSVERTQIEALVGQYLKDHPEAVIAAIEDAQANAEKLKAEKTASGLIELKDKIFNNSADPVFGNPAGDVTVVEFFDYRCPYCKRVSPDIDALISQDAKVKVVLKEFPILGPESLYAAKVALAAARQGRYEAMHRALMAHRGDFSETAIMELAKTAGVDTVRLKSDIADPAVAGLIESNLDLGRSLGIGGTPAFIIGRKVVPGAISIDDMKKLIVEARQQPS